MGTVEDFRDAVRELSQSLAALDKVGTDDMDLACAKDGSIILGANNNTAKRYITRYRIDRRHQRKLVRGHAQMKECVPCLKPLAKRRSPRKWIWDVMRAEAFLLCLHSLVIGLGAAKEAMSYKEEDEFMHLMHSVLETVATAFIVTIRMVSANHAYHELKEYRSKMQVSKEEIAGDHLGAEVKVFLAIASTVLLLDVLALFLLAFLDEGHMAWTIITNNTTLIIVGGFSHALIRFMFRELSTLREDQHKAVIYESILVLTECITAKDSDDKQAVYARANNFCHALVETEFIRQPEYVKYENTSGENVDLLTSLSVISS